MKIFHFSDTHLGISLENTSREEDFYLNFEIIINEILFLKPQIVIHSGDLFHVSKPSNKAISIVIKNFLKLEKSGIKIIIIAGNHDSPRLSLTTHPFEIFKTFNNFYVFYEPKIDFLKINGINFVILPHIHDENIFFGELKKSLYGLKDGEKNIFISHFGISSREYDEYTDEISGINILQENIEILKKFDYVALGHYHKQFNIGNMAYPGSIEHTSFNQKNYKIGYNIFDTESGKKTSFELKTRPMIDLGIINCIDFEKTSELIEFLNKNIDKNILKNTITKVILENITSKLILEFDEKLFLIFFKECFYFEYKKLKYIKNRNFKTDIKETQNIMIDNFEVFFNNYELLNGVTDKEKGKLKEELKNTIKCEFFGNKNNI